MHFHAYSWRGQGVELEREAERRAEHPEFGSSELPPLRTGAWLAKPARCIRATWDEPGQAVEWLRANFEELARSLLHDEEREFPPLTARSAYAERDLRGGTDVVWEFWLHGGVFVHLSVICCSPNKWYVGRCPQQVG